MEESWLLSQGYWLMPNAVLFNKELTDKQKLLYCLISSLCAEKGYCRATNEYLWELLDADKRTISRNIAALQEIWLINLTRDEQWRRNITLDKNVQGGRQKCLGGVDKNVYHNNTIEYYNEIKENKKEKFEEFWKQYPHARKGKKKESEEYFSKQNPEAVMKQVAILKRKIKAWLQDWQYIPACERWIRDFTELNEDVIKQDLVRICRRHLNAGWDIKQRASELKETFWEEVINEIVKSLQKKITPLFTN